jgi:hypothetical protein
MPLVDALRAKIVLTGAKPGQNQSSAQPSLE